MIRSFGLLVDHVLDALIVDSEGRVLNRTTMGEDLFWAIRGGGGASFGVIVSWKIMLVPVLQTIRAKFHVLFLGNAQELLYVMNQSSPQLGLVAEQCIQIGSNRCCFRITIQYMEDDDETRKACFHFNPYGGKMGEISEFETPFPHRAGNIYEIQYSVSWNEEGEDVANQYLSSYLNCRDVDIGVDGPGNATYAQASVWGRKYFNRNFDSLVQVKTKVDPSNFFRYEQSIASLASVHSI
ncbi:Berberine bridge enzyme-like 9 [Glycine soja]|uniref:Berberine bridge enzyme-like 9 n=1 Tax=Glycine soja TaxID=3848 RepID=A0A445KN46_GLYSO|nr:Berberine bridge enzyme-like 9 [Glycine soja]